MTELEQTVTRVWREVLGIGAPSVHDDFFALGGKSLQAIQVANRLGIALGREVAVSALFRHPTVAALAQSLATLDGHAPPCRPRAAPNSPRCCRSSRAPARRCSAFIRPRGWPGATWAWRAICRRCRCSACRRAA
ncbi:phosphopantetheine-binding protein [Massilia sp. B-10]|nr:phosphopantetheine-binding protein [Massilia sp. B-10]